MKNVIKEALVLNKIDLNYTEGLKVYYNKLILALILVFLILIATLSFLGLNFFSNDDIFYLLCCVFILPFLTYFFVLNLGRFLIINPVFILNEEKIFYLKSREWYNVLDYTFEEKSVDRGNYLLTFQMYDKNSKLIFSERNIFLKYDRWKLKKEIKRIKKVD